MLALPPVCWAAGAEPHLSFSVRDPCSQPPSQSLVQSSQGRCSAAPASAPLPFECNSNSQGDFHSFLKTIPLVSII